MTPSDPTAPATRTRYLQWGAIIAIILLVPAILIPFLLSLSQKPAFQTLDELDLSKVRSMEIFLLNRPDGGPDIGSTKMMHLVPAADYRRTLEAMKPAIEQPDEAGRGIWLGRMVVTMQDRRRQMILFHRSKSVDEGVANAAKSGPVELRIGRKFFVGPPVNEFTKNIQMIAGIETPSADDPKP